MYLRRKYLTLVELPLDKYAHPSAPLHFYTKLGVRNPKASPYWAVDFALYIWTTRYYMWTNQSRDAKSCVSQARMRNKQVRNMAVNTAVDTRETQGWHRIQVRILPGIVVFIARETQNLASLLGWRHHYKCWKRQDVICGLTKVETQNFASHKQGCAIYTRYKTQTASPPHCSGDAKFCVSTGGRHRYNLRKTIFSRRKPTKYRVSERKR